LQAYGIEIHKLPRHGISLIGKKSDIEKYFNEIMNISHEVEPFSPKNRQNEIMKILIIDDERVSYEKLATKLLVSSTSLRSDIDKLRVYFEGSMADIVSDNTGTYVFGKEISIQRVFKKYLMSVLDNGKGINSLSLEQTRNCIDEIFNEQVINFTQAVIDNIVSRSKRSIGNNYVVSLYISLVILFSRMMNNKHTCKENEFVFQNIKHMEPYMIALDIASRANASLSLILEESDIEYISELLFAHGIEPSIGDVNANEVISSTVVDIIKRMGEMLRIDLSGDDKLYDSLMYHVLPMIYRLKNGFTIKNPLLESIKKQYIVMFSLTWYVSSIFEQNFNILLNDDEVSFLTIHFQVAFDKIYQPKNILIVCPIGLSTSELVFNKLRRVIPAKDNLETASVEQVYSNDISDVSFIISLTPLSNIDKKVIYVSPLVTQEEISEINEYYLMLNEKINSLRETTSLNLQLILKYLDHDFMFWNYDFSNKKDCLKFLSDNYLGKNIVTEDFEKSINHRESQGVTSINTGVAMPHADPSTVLKTKISLLTLKKPINWDNNDVIVVIMLAVAQEDANSIKEMISGLYEIIESTEKVKQISRISSDGEFVEFLKTMALENKR
ncbi:MAG: PTS sugar transporter subunit IIA, partial [Erysipelotrichaceae bacterium]